MKVKLTKEIIDAILKDPTAALNTKVEAKDPWWVIALKVLVYFIGLLLAGMGTAEAAVMMNIV